MSLKTRAYDPPAKVHSFSDVESLKFSSNGLTVRVACETSKQG
jgi:hypothetical protein